MKLSPHKHGSLLRNDRRTKVNKKAATPPIILMSQQGTAVVVAPDEVDLFVIYLNYLWLSKYVDLHLFSEVLQSRFYVLSDLFYKDYFPLKALRYEYIDRGWVDFESETLASEYAESAQNGRSKIKVESSFHQL